MIQHIINIIKGWFTPKEQMDPHEVMLHPKEPEVPIYEEKKHCSGHEKYVDRCRHCREAAG